jgi:ankyrin repeat protein
MYPNPQDVLRFPDRANLEQYKKQAKDLVKAYRSGAPGAIGEWASRSPSQADEIAPFAAATLKDRDGALTAAQFVIARMHGFQSWPKFAAHLDSLARAASPVSQFEAAAEAIVRGDAAALRTLLREHPELIRARSTREHRATLLHYVAANGVENYRQTTPANIVEITEMLLDAGAEVDAEADMYGGRCTALGLAATSVHPEVAGVQNALMQLLIDRGALIDGPQAMGRSRSFVDGCLANGRPAAAEYLAEHGARLDLDGAAGIGRLDVVATFFNPDGTLKPPATVEQLRSGMWWACEHGRTEVVRFLLDRGVLANAPAAANRQTFLHSAAIGGQGDIVQMLLERGVPVDVVETAFGGTPLQWALHGWSNARSAGARDKYYDVIARLVRAGAPINPAWLEDQAEQTPFRQALRADARMMAALRGGATV